MRSGENCVGESVRIVLRWADHEDSNKELEPAKHLKRFPDHQSEWKVLTNTIHKEKKSFRIILTKSLSPSVNEQLDTTIFF